jgi:hypothetical protein
MISSPSVRWDVVESLQTHIRNRYPGSQGFDYADKAIDLALSENRVAESPGFLRRNVMRDARRILRRQRPAVSLSQMAVAAELPEAELVDAGVSANPALLVAATDLRDTLYDRIKNIPLGREILDARLKGVSITDCARSLGVHRHQLDHAIAKIKAITKKLLREND